MNINDKISIVNEKIRLLDRAIFIMQRNIEYNGEQKPGASFEEILKDMLSQKKALIAIKESLLSI